jgi:hypothetical protein
MSNLPDASEPPPGETPARRIAAVQRKKNLCHRITSSMALLITVLVHVVLIGGAAIIVVQQNVTGKKKTFEAADQSENTNKQVEHRLQVARRGGASGAAQSPVSANRIFSTAENALRMPAMPDLPSSGAAGFGGFGGMGAGVGMGAGGGMSTALGNGAGLGGRGFMSLNFLGSTAENVSKVVFVVDTSTEIMEPKKGGFRAFAIIREEIMRLVGRLPPSARFNVVLFRGNSGKNDENAFDVNLYQAELVSATNDNKKDFFAWMSPVNAKLNAFGPGSALRRTPWKHPPLPPEAGIDPLFLPPVWSRAAEAALAQKPDTVFVITASQGRVMQRADEETIKKRQAATRRNSEEFEKQLAAEGMTLDGYQAARARAYKKAGAELAAANKKLVAAGKDPIVVADTADIFSSSVQAALKREKITIELDRTGWTKKDGGSFVRGSLAVSDVEGASWQDFMTHFARLQHFYTPDRATLNLFLFVGPATKAEDAIANLTGIAKRNGGSFQLLTTKRLEEIKAREEEVATK